MKNILVLFFTVISFCLHAQTLSLQQCIDSALQNNISVRQSNLQQQSTAIDKQQARLNTLPTVNGNWNYGFNFGRNVDPITNTFTNNQLQSSNPGISANAILFNGMRLQNLIRQSQYANQAAEMDFKQEQDNLVLSVLLAYMQVLVNEDLIAASEAQLNVTQKQVERMQVMVQQGAAGEFELTDIKGQMASDKIALVNLKNNLQQAKLSLLQLMNAPYIASISLDRSAITLTSAPYAQTSAEVVNAAFDYMALVKANEYRVQSAAKNIQVAKGSLYPTVSITGAVGSGYSSFFKRLNPTSLEEQNTGLYVKAGSLRTPVFQEVQQFSEQNVNYTTQIKNNVGYFAGVNVQVPIFNGLQARNRVKQAELQLTNTQLEAESSNYNLRRDIEQAWLDMDAAYKRYEALQEQVNNFTESFRAATVRFENGAINAVEYLLVKTSFDRSTINLIQSKYEYHFRTKVLDYYQGKMSD